MERRSQSAVGSEKVISEVHGKHLLRRHVQRQDGQAKCVTIDGTTDWENLVKQNPWLKTEVSFVCGFLFRCMTVRIAIGTVVKGCSCFSKKKILNIKRIIASPKL